jgi:hypothetical protein
MCFNAIRDKVTPMGRKAFFPVLLSLFLAAYGGAKEPIESKGYSSL